MYILIITCLLFLFLIFSIYKATKEEWFEDSWALTSIVVGAIVLLSIIFEASFLLAKPINYKKFKIRYDNIRETVTEKDDVRDATFTMQIIGINEKIRSCREFIDSKWVGIFQNKKICELELINKED